MAEAEGDSTSRGTGGGSSSAEEASRPGLMDTGDFDLALNEDEVAAQENASGSEGNDGVAPSTPPAAKPGPGAFVTGARWFIHWHPLVFLGMALGLAAYAWLVYPEPESRQAPPAEALYHDGLDRLYRVMNPDLPLVASSPADEALAARNAFLNLFVFHRETLGDHPEFINPHLLLAESNRILAEYNPPLAEKYLEDAAAAYAAAAVWERPERERDPAKRAAYVESNFLDGSRPPGATDSESDLVALRRRRRDDYIVFRRAETDVHLGHPERARAELEDLQRAEDARRRDELRLSAQDDAAEEVADRHVFELGADEFRRLDLLLARVYDGLGQLELARGWYLRHLASAPTGRDYAFIAERLAGMAMDDGDVYRNANPVKADERYREAADFYRRLIDSPAATRQQHGTAVMGLARANSRLADLVAVGGVAGVDELGALGRGLRRWLEDFSGQQLPRRTLEIPLALGEALSRPELVIPGLDAIPIAAGGSLSAMAGGKIVTPRELRRSYLTEALENYDRIAAMAAGSPEGDHAAILAAWEAWRLGLADETEARFERMIGPLANPDLILAARLGLATAAIERGELRRAHMLVLGGYAHPMPLWFTPGDADWRKITVSLGTEANRAEPGVWSRLWEILPAEGREIAGYAASGRRLDDTYVERFLRALNSTLRRRDFYRPEYFPPRDRNFYLRYVISLDPELLTAEDVIWRNRLLLEEAWPYDVAQRGAKDNVGFETFPPTEEIAAGGFVEPSRLRDILTTLAGRWIAASEGADREERFRMRTAANAAYQAVLDRFGGDPGGILYELAANYEGLAEIREAQGNHREALALTAKAAFSYLDVSLKSRGSPREMDSLLAAGDAFFRSGLLERTVESQKLFLDRFGYASLPGTDAALAVVRAENLLGRAYWFLGMTDDAIASFRRNVARRTPDRYKSMYYLGRILMDEGMARERPELLGSGARPLPAFDRNGDPVIETALEAFNFLRQSPGINPSARAWRWATFDLGRLRYVLADRARREWQAAQAGAAAPEEERPWLALYDTARAALTESLERYALAGSGPEPGISVRVEPEDYADVMAARFETEFLLANALLVLGDGGEDETLHALARAHLENMRDRSRYSRSLFDASLDRFQLNAAIIRDQVEGGNWDKSVPLPRTRLGDDEGPTRSPQRMSDTLADSMLLLGNEYFRTGERTRQRQLVASAGAVPAGDEASGYYQESYRVWQDVYDRFGLLFGPQCMVNMGDCLARLGNAGDAANHYRMARNMADLVPGDSERTTLLRAAPAFWGGMAEQRIRDMDDGYSVP